MLGIIYLLGHFKAFRWGLTKWPGYKWYFVNDNFRLHSIWVIAKFLSNLRLSNLFSLSVEASVVLYWDMNDLNSGLSTNEKSSHIRQFYYVLQK